MLRTLLPVALLGTLAAPVQAQSHMSIQGTYAIQVVEGNRVRGCLVNGDAHAPSTPFYYKLADHTCNPLQPDDTYHLWDVYNIGYLHVIRSRVNGYCLIRGHNGHAARPTLYLWGESEDKTWCGFPDVHALVENGQALWDLRGLERVWSSETWMPEFEGSIHLPKFPGSVLRFDPPFAEGYSNFARFGTSAGDWEISFITKPPR